MLSLLKKSLLVMMLILAAAQIYVSAQADYTRSALWDKEIDAFIQSDKLAFPKQNGVLFVGGSSIRMWKTLATDFPDYPTINRGFGGSRLDDVDHYFPRIVAVYKPRLIVLYAGDNDIADGKTPNQVLSDLKTFVQLVHKSLPKTRIIFVSIKPSPSRWSMAAQFQAANKLVEAEMLKSKYLQFVDIWSAMIGSDGKPMSDIFQDDKLHMNAKGYSIWTKILSPQIKRGMKKNFR